MTTAIIAAARKRALLSLAGLSVGDALGQRFFGPAPEVLARIARRQLPPAPWRWTDDTEMALSIVEELIQEDALDAERLAIRFARRYDPHRGYGSGAHQLLQALREGIPWHAAAASLFGGAGSYGNGGAMRVAPLGAYFAEQPGRAAELAATSARVTHAHPEGVAGAVAVAVAAAEAWLQSEAGALSPEGLLRRAIDATPAGETRAGLEEAARLPASTPVDRAAERLGSGGRVSSQDTVPFALWCAAHHLGSFEEAFWATVGGLGDRDTTCAIVGGIVALSAREIPEAWLRSREPIPAALMQR